MIECSSLSSGNTKKGKSTVFDWPTRQKTTKNIIGRKKNTKISLKKQKSGIDGRESLLIDKYEENRIRNNTGSTAAPKSVK